MVMFSKDHPNTQIIRTRGRATDGDIWFDFEHVPHSIYNTPSNAAPPPRPRDSSVDAGPISDFSGRATPTRLSTLLRIALGALCVGLLFLAVCRRYPQVKTLQKQAQYSQLRMVFGDIPPNVQHQFTVPPIVTRGDTFRSRNHGEETTTFGLDEPVFDEAQSINIAALQGRISVEEDEDTGKSPRLGRFPQIDRSILVKLAKLEKLLLKRNPELEDPEHEKISSSRSQGGPPTITLIPEARVPSKNSFPLSTFNASAVCDPTIRTDSHANPNVGQRPCRFLLPLRIAEQESKARIHLHQIMHLAKQLNRILVLPNAGKSRLGACYKWPFHTYYNLDTENSDDLPEVVGLEDFKLWSEVYAKGEKNGRRGLDSQLVSLAPAIPGVLAQDAEEFLTLGDLLVHRYDTELAPETEFPGCFPSKFEHLDLRDNSLYIALGEQETFSLRSRSIPQADLGNAIIDVLRSYPSNSNTDQDAQVPLEIPTTQPPDPDVLILNWELRHPLFQTSLSPPLTYSPSVESLSSRLAPAPNSYLGIHWRMETVDSQVLAECAHSLIDLVSSMLHDTDHLAKDVNTVWFASDYPYPILDSELKNSRTSFAKSGTFRNFNEHHETAVGILKEAFKEGGELHEWDLVDVNEATANANLHKGDEDLLQDTGILGIVDKLILSRARLLVGGSKKCSKQSSFTKQVVESRAGKWTDLGNVVALF
ncbi:hypothetical protein FA15DRAFT_117870 [Coprinopsis marcescibilis]|uniref:Proteophosphoglycan 5 n=1 Tax=Coprinopsis marcescibilis TaxID=230819 RepID=A0A5C3L4C3_COPMA|nr:hypothetical protein FA15DRAFT_117870 [Coprinopsis marcescibilis]